MSESMPPTRVPAIAQSKNQSEAMPKGKVKWLTFTDNPRWGRYFIGESDSRSEAFDKGKAANKGRFVVERRVKFK